MEIDQPFSFQVDSNAVNLAYTKSPNFLIHIDENVESSYCAVYFSSNNIYFPNDEQAFDESITKKNRYEWFGNKVSYAKKHIFLRDVKKQWYLTGINSNIDSPKKLIDFLGNETKGYKTVFVGSSAGGFMSVIVGQQLNADKIFSFNGQFEILSLIDKLNAHVTDPILYRNRNNAQLRHFYDVKNFITDPKTIYYFNSNKSQWDIEQSEYVKDLRINKISFITSNHGIPFLKSNLAYVLNLSHAELKKLSGKTFHPLSFSLKYSGFESTIIGLKPILDYGFRRIKGMILKPKVK